MSFHGQPLIAGGSSVIPAGSPGGGGDPHGPSAIVQKDSALWPAANSPAPPATVVLPAPVVVGHLVAVVIAYQGGGHIDHVNGCGVAAWQLVPAYGAANAYNNAVIAWCLATAAGTTVTVNFQAGFHVTDGVATAWELAGVTALADSAAGPYVITANPQTPALDADPNQIYVGATCHNAGGAPTSYTEIPGAFDSTSDLDSSGNDCWLQSGVRIAQAVETIDRITHWPGAIETVSVAALFT